VVAIVLFRYHDFKVRGLSLGAVRDELHRDILNMISATDISYAAPVDQLAPAPPLSMRRAMWILSAAFALTVLEGAIRKWLIGSATSVLSYVVYFSKDIVVATVFFCPKQQVSSPALAVFRRWFLLGCFLVLCGSALSAAREINPVGSLLTLRATVFLPLIATLAVSRLAGLRLRWVCLLIAALTLLNCVLGIIQNSLPPDHLLNRYAVAEMSVVSAEESGARAAGTFAYISGLSVLSGIGIWAGLVLLSLARGLTDQVIGWISVVAGFGCGLASVSRGPVIIGAVTVLCWIMFSRTHLSAVISRVAVAILIFVLVIATGLVPIFTGLTRGLLQRQQTAADEGDEFYDRAFGQFEETSIALSVAPFGKGLGTEQAGGNYYASGQLDFVNFEGQFARLVMETGVVGLAGFLVVSIGSVLALQTARRHAAADDKAALFATQLLLVSMFYTNVAFNHTASAFLWMIFAAVLAAFTKRTTSFASSHAA
jgi:hypothetical protein